ncbi:MAG: SH3 domain-containing protein [Caldilineaceae bacterium]|nr:SH3 domain-containing protein [Caldilineaceae bacterium]
MNGDLEPTRTQQPPVQPYPGAPANPAPNSPANLPRRRRIPSFFWPGFAAGFLLLSMLSCGGLAVATGLNRIDLEDIQGNGAVWTPPAVIPTATLDASSEQPLPVADGLFSLTEVVRNITTSRVNIRQSPGHQGKPPTDIIAQVEPGAQMTIVGGPAPADNLTWWLIRYQSGDGRSIEGWVAEATQSGVQILGH